MKWFFIILFFVLSEQLYVACKMNGCFLFGLSKEEPPFGAPVLFQIEVAIQNLSLAIFCIWNFGIILGLILFVLHILGVLHWLVGWIVSVPILLAGARAYAYTIMATPIFVLVSLITVILSFIIFKYRWISFTTIEYISYAVGAVVSLIIGFFSKLSIGFASTADRR